DRVRSRSPANRADSRQPRLTPKAGSPRGPPRLACVLGAGSAPQATRGPVRQYDSLQVSVGHVSPPAAARPQGCAGRHQLRFVFGRDVGVALEVVDPVSARVRHAALDRIAGDEGTPDAIFQLVAF